MDFRKAAVLLVEDEAPIREVLQLALEEEGHRVCSCGSFDEAMRQLSRHSFQVLVTDVNLRGRQGDEGCRLAEEAIRLQPGIRVILMTGGTPDCLGPFRSRYPVVPVVLKPFNCDAMLAFVQAVLHDGAPMPPR